ncbi:metallophosphoesterase [Halopseudomonas bauzanensis]|uniref:metallophosphoesterase n=1 Tax=Halopseudomonas bauzanensis TaxID=653930 RepID=UPI00255474FB|nr:metallophosphoesterase [Halopseudomonas bauzanensis]
MIQNIPVHHEVPPNPIGDDWICSDVHGEFQLLMELLVESGFEPAKDRLFMLGDLIDRGPESLRTLEWVLHTPYCHSVLGNHELLFWASRSDAVWAGKHYSIGGKWAAGLSSEQHEVLAKSIQEKLPLTMTLNTESGRVGLVHAQAPVADWRQLATLRISEGLARKCTWGSKKPEGRSGNIRNIDVVVSGHIGCERWVRHGNQLWIDTMLRTGKPTLIKARSLLRLLESKWTF